MNSHNKSSLSTYDEKNQEKTDEDTVCFQAENADCTMLGEACKKNHDATSLCPTLFSYYNSKEDEELWEQATNDYENAVRLNCNSCQYGLAEATLRTRDLVKAGKYIFAGVIDGRRHLENLDAEVCFIESRMVVLLFRREQTFDQTLGHKDLAGFLPGTIANYFSSEVNRSVWKPAFMNDMASANVPTAEEHIDVPFLQSYPGFCHLYRPWMCLFARTLYVIVSVITVVIGFYDLYKNVPVLKATASRLCGPLFDWVETWDMESKVKYLGMMLCLHKVQKAVKWAITMARAVKTYDKSMQRALLKQEGVLQQRFLYPHPLLELFLAMDLALISMVGCLP